MARPDLSSLSANGVRRIYSLLCAMAHCDRRGITPDQARILARYQAILDLHDQECRKLERDAARLDRLSMGKRRGEQKFLLDGLIEIALSDGRMGRREERLLLGIAKRCGIERSVVRSAVSAFKTGGRSRLSPNGPEVVGVDSASYVEFDPSHDQDIWAQGDPHHPDSGRNRRPSGRVPGGNGLFGNLEESPPAGRSPQPEEADPFASSVEVGSLRRAEEAMFGSGQGDIFEDSESQLEHGAFEDSLLHAALLPDSGVGSLDALFDDPEASLLGGPSIRREAGMQRLLTSAEVDDTGDFEFPAQVDAALLSGASLSLPGLPALPPLPALPTPGSVDEDLSSAGYRPLESLDAPLGLDVSQIDADGDPLLRDESETLMFPGEANTPSSPFAALDESHGLDLDGPDDELQGFWAEQAQGSSSRRGSRRSAPSAEDSLAGLL